MQDLRIQQMHCQRNAALVDCKPAEADRVDSILRFFRSQWYACLTQVDAEYLIKRLDKEG